MGQTREVGKTSSKGPSSAMKAPVAKKDQSDQEHTISLIPIIQPSDTTNAGARGTYKIPSTLHASLSKFLDPNVRNFLPRASFYCQEIARIREHDHTLSHRSV
ncbi:MAG: hypothetical protein Q9221_006705 [Calogaya cf. arnoldii]